MKYKKANIENLEEEVKEALKKKKGLFVYGGTGTGKTYTLHAIANHKMGKVNNFLPLVNQAKSQVRYLSRFVSDICSQDYLFLDDLGAETTSTWIVDLLYMIINRRYEKEKPVFLSTNLTLEEFQARYGDRIMSRLVEMCEFVELKGEDKRLEPTEEEPVSEELLDKEISEQEKKNIEKIKKEIRDLLKL